LTLQTTDEGIRMFAEPVREIENIHGSKHTWEKLTVRPGERQLPRLSGELFHIKGRFLPGDAKEFGFVIRGTRITYNPGNAQLSCQGSKAALKPVNGKIDLELLVDRNSIEIFGNGGHLYMPIGGILPEDDKSIKLFSDGSTTHVETLDIWELRSIWR
ncbi:MAG: GH32 C-terminal domain-containing protein, partial [Desulfobacteraceae bacterium]|nr:GH32 C-terminal domain-containing protein [Desulfobacteraceae bacterium]